MANNASAGAHNKGITLGTILNEGLVFNNNTRLSFDCKIDSGYLELLLTQYDFTTDNINRNESMLFPVWTGDTNPCGISIKESSCNEVTATPVSFITGCSNTWGNFNFTWGDVINFTIGRGRTPNSDWNLNHKALKNVNMIVFLGVHTNGNPVNISIRNFYIYNVTNVSTINSLPITDLSYNTTECYNSSNNNLVNVSLSINSTDNEGDTIYYSLVDSITNQLTFKQAFESTPESEVTSIFNNNTFVNKYYSTVGGDKNYQFNKSIYTNCRWNELIFNDIWLSSTDCYTSHDCLFISNTCSQQPLVIGDLNIKQNFTFLYDVILKKDVGNVPYTITDFWLVDKSNSFDNAIDIRFNYTNNMIILSKLNLSGSDTFFNGTIGTMRSLRVVGKFNESNNKFKYSVYVWNGSKIFSNMATPYVYTTYGTYILLANSGEFTLNNSNPSYLVYIPQSPYNEEFVLDNIYAYSSFGVNNWTTTKPTDILLQSSGNFNFILKVTDEPHKDSNYTSYPIYLTIQDCKYQINSVENVITNPTIRSGFLNLGIGLKGLCSVLDLGFNTGGFYINACTILQFLFFCFSIALTMVLFAIIHDYRVILAGFPSFMIFFSIFVEWGIYIKVILALMFTIGVILTIVNIFINRANGGTSSE